MSPERRSNQQAPKERKRWKTAAKVLAAGGAAGLAGVAGITIEHHRNLTHRSLEPHPAIAALIHAEQSSLGVGDTTIWASVHRIHHEMTDASLYPFYKIAGALDWAQKPENQGKVAVPETFGHLDPFVEKFTKEEVATIGGLAKKHLQEKLGDTYKEREYTQAEVQDLLHPTEPQYQYPEFKKHSGEWTQDDIAQIMLTDPHSPALTRGENGVRRVALKNIGLYQKAAGLFQDKPDLKPEDLQHEDGENTKSRKRDVVAGFVLPSAAVLFARRRYKPRDFVTAAVAGSAINGVRVATELFGGNVTNSMGHAGVFDQSRLAQSLLSKKYPISLNEDGSLTTDTVHSGIAGKVLSWATFDEVGGQAEHHAHPDKIAYTSEKGLKAVKDAPWGSFLTFLAKSKIPGLKEGAGFGDLPRPDVPHQGVLLIQEARVRQMKQAAKTAA